MFYPCLQSVPLTKSTDLDLELVPTCCTVATLLFDKSFFLHFNMSLAVFFYTDSFWSVTLDLSFNSLSLFWCEGKAFEGRGQREWDFHTICLRQLFCCMICFTIIFYLVSQFYRLRYKLCITGLWLKAKFFISPMSNYVLWMAESL